MRVSKYLSQWLQWRAPRLAPRTRDCYASTIRNHIDPAIGHRQLHKLQPRHVAALIDQLAADGHGRTAQLVYAILHSALRDASRDTSRDSNVSRHAIITVNPVDMVPRPGHVSRHYKHLDQADIPRYLDAVATDRLALAWLLALLCGLRRGEICGLMWPDVDLAAMVLHIHNQRVSVCHAGTIDTAPKSAAGRRDVPIPAALLPLLAIAQAPDGYVITNLRGDPYTPSGLDHAHRAMVRRADLPPISPHGLRHTMATLAVSSGVHIRVLQSILGHASYQITADTYAHVYASASASAVDRVAQSVLHSSQGLPHVGPWAPDS